MKKTGQRLKEAREARGISLQEVSVHLKISNRILKALEDGDSSQLPAKTFLRGFVQSYAHLLRLDTAEILELFQAEMGTTHPKMITKFNDLQVLTDESRSPGGGGAVYQSTTSFGGGASAEMTPITPVSTYKEPTTEAITTIAPLSQEQKKSESLNQKSTMTPAAPSISVDHKTWSLSKQIGTVFIIIAIAGVIFGLVRTIEKYEKEAQIVETPPVDIPTAPRSNGKPTLLTPITNEDSNALNTDQMEDLAAAASNQEAQEKTESAKVVEKPEIKADNKTVEEKKIEEKKVDEKSTQNAINPSALPTSPAPTPTPQATPNVKTETNLKTVDNEGVDASAPKKAPEGIHPQEVIVEALDRVIVEYSIDDKSKATVVLSPEKVHTFRGDKKLRLNFSDGGSINIIHNGKDKGVPGNLGKPLQLNFPE